MDSSIQLLIFMIITYSPLVTYCLIKLIKNTNKEYKEIKRLIEMDRADIVYRRYRFLWRDK